MFGKRKGKEPAQQPDVRKPSGPQTPGGAGKLTTVIVPRSTIEKAGEPGDYALIQGVINFVNGMMQQGLYARFELIDKALQAFHSDFYLAQVLNGGHSQFIHNCFQNLPIVIEDVRAGLTAMNARAHLAIFEQAAAWIIANPEEVKKQTGFEGGRAPLLDELDTQFYKANKEQSIIQLSSLWIKSWPELRPVDDADYPEAMRRVVMLNPLRKERLLAASVRNLITQTFDRFQVAVGLACASGPNVEIKLSIHGGTMMLVEGKEQMAFYVRTNAPQARYCVVTDDYAAAYERIEDGDGTRSGVAAAADPDARLARSVGRKLSQVKRETIEGVIELSMEYAAAPAIDLALRRANIDPNGAIVSPAGIEPGRDGATVKWLIAAGGQAFVALSFPKGTALLRPGESKHLALVSRAEAEAHARLAAAGRIVPPQ